MFRKSTCELAVETCPLGKKYATTRSQEKKTKPLKYVVKRTPRRIVIYVILGWLAAACMSLPPLLVMRNEHTSETDASMCTVSQNAYCQSYATFGSFYIPLVVMIQKFRLDLPELENVLKFGFKSVPDSRTAGDFNFNHSSRKPECLADIEEIICREFKLSNFCRPRLPN
ncbi:5-hydroxytryptamine receptor 1 [Eufriesea mexicana]|nr:5-hydroxytryptamine receptor 1 [Eufriesea mexicana]